MQMLVYVPNVRILFLLDKSIQQSTMVAIKL